MISYLEWRLIMEVRISDLVYFFNSSTEEQKEYMLGRLLDSLKENGISDEWISQFEAVKFSPSATGNPTDMRKLDGQPIFPPSKLANRWLLPLAEAGGRGVEIGGSAHNDFLIPNTINVDFTDSMDTSFKKDEIRLCGRAMKVDVVAFADNLPFEDSSFDFLINSHVFEHQTNPLKCLLEWCRVVRPGGIIFSVIPHRDAAKSDAPLSLTTIDHQIQDFRRNETTETHPVEDGGAKFGHYHRYSFESYIELISFFNDCFGPTGLEILESLNVDDRVGNGCSFVQRVEKEPA